MAIATSQPYDLEALIILARDRLREQGLNDHDSLLIYRMVPIVRREQLRRQYERRQRPPDD